jgi:shikimate dehydrogenase
VEYVLRKLGIGYRLVSRRPRPDTGDLGYEDVDGSVIAGALVIINTTPVGMYPNIGDCPPLPYEALGSRHYLYDLVYNPERTLFLQRGAARGAVVENGLEMLVLQAEESWRIWSVTE